MTFTLAFFQGIQSLSTIFCLGEHSLFLSWNHFFFPCWYSFSAIKLCESTFKSSWEIQQRNVFQCILSPCIVFILIICNFQKPSHVWESTPRHESVFQMLTNFILNPFSAIHWITEPWVHSNSSFNTSYSISTQNFLEAYLISYSTYVIFRCYQ